jgi:hypothetical protein
VAAGAGGERRWRRARVAVGAGGGLVRGSCRAHKWIALSNTTLGLLMATINSSIVLTGPHTRS